VIGVDLDLDLTGKRRDDPVPLYAQGLRRTVRTCLFQLGTVLLFALLCVLSARQRASGLPSIVPLTLSMLAAVMILLSSRFRSATVRRAIPRSTELPVSPDAVLAAYKRGTLVSFAILELAALLGVGVALTAGAATYGIVLCAAAAVAMLTRWPRASEVDRLIRGRIKP
jgi:hypothetical protein